MVSKWLQMDPPDHPKTKQRFVFKVFLIFHRFGLNSFQDGLDDPRRLPKWSQVGHLGRQIGEHRGILSPSWPPCSLQLAPRGLKMCVPMQYRKNTKHQKTLGFSRFLAFRFFPSFLENVFCVCWLVIGALRPHLVVKMWYHVATLAQHRLT